MFFYNQSGLGDRSPATGGGKSELHRARRSRNGTGGDPMDSATEKKTARKGKGETVG